MHPAVCQYWAPSYAPGGARRPAPNGAPHRGAPGRRARDSAPSGDGIMSRLKRWGDSLSGHQQGPPPSTSAATPPSSPRKPTTSAAAAGGGSPKQQKHGWGVRAPASAMQQSSPERRARRGAVRAGAATRQFEWEVYREEHDIHQRTLRLVRTLTETFRQEWDTYRAEFGAQMSGPVRRGSATRPARLNTMLGARPMAMLISQAAAGAEADVVEEGMHPGGYHPVQPGEKFKDGRYTALFQLGQGHYGTVWMVHDAVTGQQVAMKIVRSANEYREAALDEVALLSEVRLHDPEGTSNCVLLLDHFDHEGPHGTHVCEVLEALGNDLLSLIRVYNHRGIPVDLVRHVVRQVLVALDYLHMECNIIHTDLKPENVMLSEPLKPRGEGARQRPSFRKAELPMLEERVLGMGCKIVDFGNACWIDHHISDEIQTRQYRAPEVILGAGYDGAADMWSLACLTFELLTGDFLFYPKEGSPRPGADGEEELSFTKDEDHLAQMIELLQCIPLDVLARGRHSTRYFTADGQLRRIGRLNHWPLERVLIEKYGWPREEAESLADFMLCMMQFDPNRRATAAEMLEHPWLQVGLMHQPASSAVRNAGPPGTHIGRVQWGSPRRSESPLPNGHL